MSLGVMVGGLLGAGTAFAIFLAIPGDQGLYALPITLGLTFIGAMAGHST